MSDKRKAAPSKFIGGSRESIAITAYFRKQRKKREVERKKQTADNPNTPPQVPPSPFLPR